jgi:hypothetical protein
MFYDTAGTDDAHPAHALTILAGSSSADLIVTPIDDELAESDEALG